jgi:hypothetical protein
MKITQLKDGVVTVGFDGWFGLREAISLPRLVAHLRARSLTLDFTRARFESESVIAALIPALASLHRPAVQVVGIA